MDALKLQCSNIVKVESFVKAEIVPGLNGSSRISSLVLSNLTILIFLRCCFRGVDGFSLTGSCQKLKKNRRWVSFKDNLSLAGFELQYEKPWFNMTKKYSCSLSYAVYLQN